MALNADNALDSDAFALGVIFAFCEMVAAGVKQLALSEPATPERMQAILPEARRMAEQFKVELYLETDLIQTDLFPAYQAGGKQVLLIYRGDALERYLALKRERERLSLGRGYAGEPRRRLARAWGKLLSYSDARINELMAQNAPT
ncbi:MAG: hypothetical protein SFU83_11720 [Meiothermus sp.]|nr:hypothetical protein [Meiothermus sp.]